MTDKTKKIIAREEKKLQILSSLIIALAIAFITNSQILPRFFKSLPHLVVDMLRIVIWLPTYSLVKLLEVTGLGDFVYYYLGIGTYIIFYLLQALYYFLIGLLITKLFTIIIKRLPASSFGR